MSSVAGLQSALKNYSSDKIKDRAQGQEAIREIFSDRDNLNIFQNTARQEGGAGWIAFFQCIFQVVVADKKAVMKKGGKAQGQSV
jgi:ataxia telangiectasia mutated family protein